MRDPSRVVLLHAEANAWPYAAGAARRPEELVHLVAERADGSERIDVPVAPSGALSPSTSRHVRMSEEQLLGGASRTEAGAALARLVREGDVLAAWSRFSVELVRNADLALPAVVDLRRAVGVWLGCPTGSLASLCERLALEPAPQARGRGGERLAQGLAIYRRMIAS